MTEDRWFHARAPGGGPWLRRGDRTECRTVEQLAALWPGARFSSTASDFYANALRLQFTRFRVESTANSAFTCVRNRALIRAHPRPAIAIEAVLEGRMHRQQQGLSFVQDAGDVAITVLDEPFSFAWAASGRSVRTVAAVDALAPALQRPDALRAGLVRPSALVVSYVGFIRNLVDIAEPDAVEQRALESALFTLHETLLLEASRVAPTARTLQDRIELHVQEHLSDPTLSPTSIAVALNVSVRAVHKAFNSNGVTLAAEIRRQRVLAATRLLQDSTGTVLLWQVARQVGFSNIDRLRRSFNAVLGLNASDYLEHLSS